uniref:Uncharacterized protein n=1 Tax=Lactuca sativa TaxID=4236 RepID=A0A9R1XE28_LACSA|nr:hypothetical protein LSAT_V11C500247600 [Lactuca sativa]
MLLFGGRPTLGKFILDIFLLYYFSIFKEPIKVIAKFKSITMKFLWDSIDTSLIVGWIRGGSLRESKHILNHQMVVETQNTATLPFGLVG